MKPHTIRYIMLVVLFASLSACSNRKPLPSFDLLLMDSATQFNTNSIPTGRPIVLFYFSPECPYCQAQTEDMVANMKSLSNIRFYMLTTFPFGQLKTYYKHYDLKKYANVTVGRDYTFYFGNNFKATGVPYTVIYNKDKRLKQILMGRTSTNTIKNIALE